MQTSLTDAHFLHFSDKKYYDVAVLKLTNDIVYTNEIYPICLPDTPSNDLTLR